MCSDNADVCSNKCKLCSIKLSSLIIKCMFETTIVMNACQINWTFEPPWKWTQDPHLGCSWTVINEWLVWICVAVRQWSWFLLFQTYVGCLLCFCAVLKIVILGTAKSCLDLFYFSLDTPKVLKDIDKHFHVLWNIQKSPYFNYH